MRFENYEDFKQIVLKFKPFSVTSVLYCFGRFGAPVLWTALFFVMFKLTQSTLSIYMCFFLHHGRKLYASGIFKMMTVQQQINVVMVE